MLCRTIDTHRDPSEIVEFVSDSHLNMIISHGVLLQLKDVTLDPHENTTRPSPRGNPMPHKVQTSINLLQQLRGEIFFYCFLNPYYIYILLPNILSDLPSSSWFSQASYIPNKKPHFLDILLLVPPFLFLV